MPHGGKKIKHIARQKKRGRRKKGGEKEKRKNEGEKERGEHSEKSYLRKLEILTGGPITQ